MRGVLKVIEVRLSRSNEGIGSRSDGNSEERK